MSAMPNVLMLGPSLEKAPGGMATVEKSLLDAIRRRGDKAVFIPTFEEGSKAKKLVIAATAYAKFIRELEMCDLVHVHMASRGSFRRKKIFMEKAFRRGKPVLLHLHGSEFAVWFDSECSPKEQNDIRSTFGRCAKVAVLSKEWKDFLLDRRICESNRIEVLHNAVEVPSESTTDYTRNDVLFMGRLDDRKSPDVLLRAAARVLEGHPDATFTFGGDGDASKYERMAVDLGISANCFFMGWVDGAKKCEAFRKSAIYCLPSKNEGMPMSVLEAMSYGLATVATPVGGVPQVIDDGVNGFLFPVDDVDALAERLGALMDDTALKEKIGRQGRTCIEEAFSLEAFMDRMIGIYEEICE